MHDVRCVNAGVDTLMVNVYYTTPQGEKTKQDLQERLRVQLEAWKREAQYVGESVVTPLTFNGLALQMCPNGALHGQFPWMLKTDDITFYVSTGSWNGIGAVRFNSPFLWSSALLQAVIQVQVFVNSFFEDEMYLQASAVDLCADTAGWRGIEHLDKKRDFVSRSRKRAAHAECDWGSDGGSADYAYGLQETGYDFSRKGSLSLVIYDKSREIKKSGKTWFEDIWQASGLRVEDGHVWRNELRWKREALHDLWQGVDGQEQFHGIEDVYVLLDRLPLLWAYGVGHVEGDEHGLPDGWIRCVTPGNDKTRRRWPTRPEWSVVQAAFTQEIQRPENFGEVVRKKHQKRNIDKGVEAVMGYLTSLSAWVGGDLVEEGADLSMALHWLAISGNEYLERVERDFSAEVQRKRSKLPRV